MIKPIVERIGSDLKINLFKKQEEFVNSEVDDVLFGGAAGPGKSMALLMFSAIRRMKHPKSIGLMLRRTCPQLEKSLILKSREIYPYFGAVYNESRKVWIFPNESRIQFGYCERDADAYNFHSDEYHDICFDEASLMTEFQLTYIATRCRSTLAGCKPLVRLASNPGNVGHMYLKKKYVEPSKIGRIWLNETTGKSCGFIPAKLSDNPAMMELDPGYINRLKELGSEKYKALAEGSWDVFEGAFWDVDLTPGKGVLPYTRIPDTETFKFLSMDWGYSEPSCVLWWEVMPSGRIFVYREIYRNLLSNQDLAQLILDMSPSHEKYEYIVIPPELWGKKSEFKDGAESIHDQLEGVLMKRMPTIKANRNRLAGWDKVRQHFAPAADGRPWLQISPVCGNLIRTIPMQIYDDHDPNDMSRLGEDHACDALRYGIMSLNNVPRGTDEHLTPYERVFGVKSGRSDNIAYLPVPGRGGY